MIQKKVCMVGMYGTGKTSLVQRFVRSIFSPRYLSTVGVKIDRKDIAVDGQIVHFMLWDLEGRDQHHDVNPSYLKGASGIIFVVDGTRPDTLSGTMQLRERVLGEIGAVPSVLALNKADLTDEWRLAPSDVLPVESLGWHILRTSARTGDGVEPMFLWLARSIVSPSKT